VWIGGFAARAVIGSGSGSGPVVENAPGRAVIAIDALFGLGRAFAIHEQLELETLDEGAMLFEGAHIVRAPFIAPLNRKSFGFLAPEIEILALNVVMGPPAGIGIEILGRGRMDARNKSKTYDDAANAHCRLPIPFGSSP
jgi:hypothetical protein